MGALGGLLALPFGKRGEIHEARRPRGVFVLSRVLQRHGAHAAAFVLHHITQRKPRAPRGSLRPCEFSKSSRVRRCAVFRPFSLLCLSLLVALVLLRSRSSCRAVYYWHSLRHVKTQKLHTARTHLDKNQRGHYVGGGDKAPSASISRPFYFSRPCFAINELKLWSYFISFDFF